MFVSLPLALHDVETMSCTSYDSASFAFSTHVQLDTAGMYPSQTQHNINTVNENNNDDCVNVSTYTYAALNDVSV
jgi:hypothetical protein